MNYQIVPESAPFSTEQRAWLNGFLAGIFGVLDHRSAQDGSAASLAAAASVLSPSLGADQQAASISEESFPWQDPALPLSERMKMADGKQLEHRMMAAMAQLNCGSCGYVCKTYSAAIANGSEKNLTLCSPGGVETTKTLRVLAKELLNLPKTNDSATSETRDTSKFQVGTRENPANVKLVSSVRLNAPDSQKDTRHVVLDIEHSGVRYRVGDALGVWPTNCRELVTRIIDAARIDKSASDRLLRKCLRTITPDLIDESIKHVCNRPKMNGENVSDVELVRRLEAFRDSDTVDEMDVLEFFETFPASRLSDEQVLRSLNDLRPRLYSIASSQSKHLTQVHLTVGRVEAIVRDRPRKGVASTMFADRLRPAANLQVFVQPSHGFTVPDDPKAAMIMVGPGTGIAPFIAFMQQREADQAEGKNWLFFGDQRSSSDFLYRETLEAWLESGHLTRLDVAFSRDCDHKVYVQHRMKEQGEELFRWLESGAYFFVCGDASRMAVDVDKSLLEIVSEHGRMNESQAKNYLLDLIGAKRYVRDVY